MKKVIRKNQVIITSLAILIAIAGYLNFADVDLGFGEKEASTESSSILDQVDYDLSDESAVVDENSVTETAEVPEDGSTPGEAVLTGASDFAAQAKLSREQVRSQSKADLQAILNNTEVGDDQKQEAVNTMVQMKGHDEAMKYFVELDKNIAQYTKSGSGPSKKVGIGECVIGIGFLHDGITQILDGYDNISLVIPASGTSFEIGATAIFKGAKHPNAAKLWIEFALSPDCVNIAKENESFQFLVIDNAEQPEEATAFGLDPENVIDYDFEDAKNNTSKYVEDYFNALGAAADGRFQTE